jgi:hypothetical protein
MKPFLLPNIAFGLAASCLVAVPSRANAAEPAQDENLAYATGVQTYINGFPVMDLYRTLWETSFDPKRGHDQTLNEYFVFDRLITSKDDWVITPNNDTIYLRAFLDLRAEPVVLVIPPMGDRQYWVPVSDMRHDFDANLSWDTVGARGGNFALCPPGWQGVLPEGVKRIDMSTPIGWTLPRISVNGDADLPAAVELQKKFKLVPLSQWGAAEVTRPKSDAADFPRFTRAELTNAKAYELVVPKDVPMLNFWSVVLYDNDTRCMIENPQGKTEANSRQKLVKNADGSVRRVFSSKKPEGVPEANWIQTTPKKGFFAYFRWYSPTKAFFDRSWKMGNIKETK